MPSELTDVAAHSDMAREVLPTAVPFLYLSVVQGEPDEDGSKHSVSVETDADGALRIEGGPPPRSTEVGTDDPSIHVQQFPFDGVPGDPLIGYIIMVVRR